MFYKIDFAFKAESGEEKKFEFYADEIVHILHSLHDKHLLDTPQLSNNASIPQYSTINDRLSQKFEQVANQLIEQYSQHHHRTDIREILTNLNDNTAISLFDATLPTEPFLTLSDDFLKDLLRFEAISELNTIEKWLEFHFYFKNDSSKETLEGWWFLMSDRLILIDKATYYASDCGTIDELISLFRSCLHTYHFEHAPMTALADLKKHYKVFDENEHNVIIHMFVSEINELALIKTINSAELNKIFLQVLAEACILKKNNLFFTIAPDIQISESYIHLFKALELRFFFVADFLTAPYIQEVHSKKESMLRVTKYAYVHSIMHPDDAQHYIFLDLMTNYKQQSTSHSKTLNFRGNSAFGKASGEDYRCFARMLRDFRTRYPLVTNSQMAKAIRDVVEGKKSSIENAYFIPNLVVAWFAAEVRRCPVSFYTTLMLLDLMERECSMPEYGHNYYDLRNLLIHPLKHEDISNEPPAINIDDLYGDKVPISSFDGAHSMVHANAAGQANAQIGKKLNPVHQKEASITIHWLCEKIRLSNKDINCTPIVASAASQLTPQIPPDGRLTKIKNILHPKAILSTAEKEKKLFLEKIIFPHLLERFSSLEQKLPLTDHLTNTLVSPTEIHLTQSSSSTASHLVQFGIHSPQKKKEALFGSGFDKNQLQRKAFGLSKGPK